MMNSVLIVDDDTTLRDALAREARGWGFDVYTENNAAAALELLRTRSIDVLVTDLRMGGSDGIDLIRAARADSPQTQTLLMSAFATARDHQLATEHGTIRVLCKPFSPSQLRAALREALDARDGFRGTVHGLSLLDMLQLFHLSRRNLTLVVSGVPPGFVHFDHGELISATFGDLVGADALRALLRNQSGTVSTQPIEPGIQRTISAPFDGLLVSLLQQIDESSRSSPPAEVPFRTTLFPEPFESVAPEPDQESVSDGSALAAASAFASLEDGSRIPVAASAADLGDDVQSAEKLESKMAEIDEACQSVVKETDGGIACGVVDLDTGMLLGVYNNAGYSQSLNEIVAAACMDMFRGSNVNRVHQAVRAHRGVPENGEHYFEEIHVASRNNYHFMKTIAGGKAVMVLVTSRTTNIGMGWAVLKAMKPRIEPLVP